MELFAIVLSAPAAFVASCVFQIILRWVVTRHGWIAAPVATASAFALLGLFVEFVFLCVTGPVGTREFVGPLYYPLHVAGFLAGVPSLAAAALLAFDARLHNLMLIVSNSAMCAAFAVYLAVTQYHVSESLFGVG